MFFINCPDLKTFQFKKQKKKTKKKEKKVKKKVLAEKRLIFFCLARQK